MAVLEIMQRFLVVLNFSEAENHWPVLLTTVIVGAARAIPLAHAHAVADFMIELVRRGAFENVVDEALAKSSSFGRFYV